MSDNFHKFLFLGVMIVIAILANHNSAVPEQRPSFTYGKNEAPSFFKSPPIFVLEPPQKTLNNLGANISASQFVKIAEGDLSLPSTTANGTSALSEVSSLDTPPAQSSQNSLVIGDSRDQTFFYRKGDALPPPINAHIVLIADLQSGEHYLRLGTEKYWPLASITKLMSAVIVFQNIDTDQKTTVTSNAFAVDPSEQALRIGDAYSISDLLRVMLLPSSNVSAETIAQFYGREKFIMAMNAAAGAWQLNDMHFSDPTGFSSSNQSSAENIFLLAKRLYIEYPKILAITREKSALATELNSGKKISVNNINIFAGREDFLGGKTGYTDEAGGNLLSIFSYKNRPIVIIVLGTNDRFGDTEKLLNWFEGNYSLTSDR